ncbi:acyltransferase [Trypanosoma rangeli]|uniref:Acyltransferase n=1 Tax=Trypanosoma rangeli TaxID=5698 RepID=A0A3R7LCF8_TRYRA|nr:acyltransferase [Trypanosoma rangeli]RNF11604.1 acyltransferase [Trypanosoma rangeli]|eukprot:RNF11604.1 acyltransferase [Trypanosoma rangeli]
MSTRKKSREQHLSVSATEENGAVQAIHADTLLPAVRNLSLHCKEIAFRPAHSRLVNLNCLRPHGALQESELRGQKNSSKVPETLLNDIVAMVNDSQRLLRRSPDFHLGANSTEAEELLRANAFRLKWLGTVAKTCDSAVAYPFTEFCFIGPLPQNWSNATLPADEGGQRCIRTAETIQRILRVFATASNSSQCQLQQLLFHVVRNERSSVEGLVSVNYNSRHITVCCGLYYYRVDVLDTDGFIVDVETLAERLRTVREHANRTETTLFDHKLLLDAREDLNTFYQLLGSLTEIDRTECAAVLERLKNTDPANAASLTYIDTGIFTVVLQSLGNEVASARWYRSALVLEERKETGVLAMRGHSILIHGDDLMDFLMQVLSWDNASHGLSKSGGESFGTGQAPTSDGILPPGVEHLDLWLQWKHRKPMRPYAVVKLSPPVFPLSIPQETDISFVYICMSAVLAVQQVLTCCTEFPTVLVAFPNQRGGLSAALMYSYEIEAFIRSLRCGSVLVERHTKTHLALKALQSLAEIIDDCFHETYPIYSLAKLLLAEGKATTTEACMDNAILGTVDLHVTVGMLGSGKKVLGCETCLLLPSRFSLTCGAVGSISRESPLQGPSGATLTCASLRVAETDEDSTMGAQLAACITEKTHELLSLVPNVNPN